MRSGACGFQEACSYWDVDAVAAICFGAGCILELPRNSRAIGKRNMDLSHHGAAIGPLDTTVQLDMTLVGTRRRDHSVKMTP